MNASATPVLHRLRNTHGPSWLDSFQFPAEMKSAEEINELKAQWCADPCWDIEHTEGFEAHHDELKAFSDTQEEKWEQEAEARLTEKAERIGCPGNLTLARYVETLEHRLQKLENPEGE